MQAIDQEAAVIVRRRRGGKGPPCASDARPWTIGIRYRLSLLRGSRFWLGILFLRARVFASVCKARVHRTSSCDGTNRSSPGSLESVLTSEDPEPTWRYVEFSQSIGMESVVPIERVGARWKALLDRFPFCRILLGSKSLIGFRHPMGFC